MLTLDAAEQAWLDANRVELRTRNPGVVEHLVIYGSEAYGDARDDSDLDLLIVIGNNMSDIKRPVRSIRFETATPSYAVRSIMAFPQSECDRLKELRCPYRESLEDGVSVS